MTGCPEFENAGTASLGPARLARPTDTYVKIKGADLSLRASPKREETVDFLLRARETSPRPKPSSGLLSGVKADSGRFKHLGDGYQASHRAAKWPWRTHLE